MYICREYILYYLIIFIFIIFQIVCNDDSLNLIVKISLFLNNDLICSTKSKTKQNMNTLEHAKEHRFMLSGHHVKNYRVKVQLKQSKWMKSMLIDKLNKFE